MIAALLLGVVSAIVRPIAFVLTLPITIVTLGLFLLVLNAAMVGLVAWITPGFRVDGFWTAFLTADRQRRVMGRLGRDWLERKVELFTSRH